MIWTLLLIPCVLLCGLYLLGLHVQRNGRRPSKRGGNSRAHIRESVTAIVRSDDGTVQKIRGE